MSFCRRIDIFSTRSVSNQPDGVRCLQTLLVGLIMQTATQSPVQREERILSIDQKALR